MCCYVPQAVLAAQPVASTPVPAAPTSAPGTPAKPTTYAAVMSKIDTPVKEPPKGWVADPDERQSILAQRKLFMVQQARRCVWRCAAERLWLSSCRSHRVAGHLAVLHVTAAGTWRGWRGKRRARTPPRHR